MTTDEMLKVESIVAEMRAEIERLTAALREITSPAIEHLPEEMQNIARTALKEQT